MTKTIVLCAFFLVAQHFICFRRFLELFFGRFIAGVTVGVILHRYFPVSLLDLVGRRTFCNAQYFVIISFRHFVVLIIWSLAHYFPTTTFANRMILSFR